MAGTDKDEQIEAEMQELLGLLKSGRTIRDEHRYNLEYHTWGYDKTRQDFYHHVQTAAAGVEDRWSYGERAVRYYLEHWIKLKGLDGIKKEQGWK